MQQMSSTQEEEFKKLLEDLETGTVALNRAEIVRHGLKLLSAYSSENVYTEVEISIERPPPSISHIPPSTTDDKDEEKNATENDGDKEEQVEFSEENKQLAPKMYFETTTTVSSPFIVDVKSSLAQVFGGKQLDQSASKVGRSNKYRLLMYRFLLNGLAEISGERQLLMAAAPMFAAEATDAHKKSHFAAVEAVLKGVRYSSNVELKRALKLQADVASSSAKEEATQDKENISTSEPSTADKFAENLCLGLVLYFEQKTSSSIFTTPHAATGHGAVSGRSKQGRFLNLVSLMSFVVAEGISNTNDKGDTETKSEEPTQQDSSKQSSPTGSGPVEAVFLATLFAILYRLVPIFVPLRGDEHLFGSSAVPDLLRLLIQYHDPVLCLHLDQHPLKKRASPIDENHSSVEAEGASTQVVAPARTLADAGYQYLTGLGVAAFGDDSGDHAPTEDALTLLDYLILRYDDAHYIGCLSFIATVMLHRGELLKLTDGEQIANFWGKFAAGGFAKGTSAIDLGVPIAIESSTSKEGEEGTLSGAKRFTTSVLKAQALNENKERLPPALESIAPFLLSTKEDEARSVPLSALLSIVVSNLSKNTPSSARVFANAILSSTNGGWGAHGSGAGGSSVADQIEQQRAYVASFPVMPVTAEELALVFPAGASATSVTKQAENGDEVVETVHTAASSRAPPSGLDASASSHSHLQYLVLDSRAENSFLFARLPTAIHIGSTIGYDAEQLQSTIRGLQDAWSSHLTIMGTGRSIVEELNLLKLIAMRFVEKGFPHVSIIDGGFKACIPFLKAGTMEYVQSPQRQQREGVAATGPNAIPSVSDTANVQRTTLNSTEEIAGEIVSQASVIKEQAAVIGGKAAEQAVVLKEKATVGLKKTGENLSEAASTAAVWGASVWSKFSEKVSTGVASAKDQIQKARENTTATSSNNNNKESLAGPSSPPLAPTHASDTSNPRPTSNSNFNQMQNQQGDDSNVFVTTTDAGDDNDEDLGLIMSVAPTSKVALSSTQSAAARDAIMTSPPVSGSGPTRQANNQKSEEAEILTGKIVSGNVKASEPQASPVADNTPEIPPSNPKEAIEKEENGDEKDQEVAPKSPTAKAPEPPRASSTNVIDDLFEDIVPAATTKPTTSASPKATKPATTTATAPAKTATKSTGNAFDDIFGEDF